MTEQATVDALIDAAEAGFAEQGIEEASLRSMMRTAGVDPGAIHYHFGGRDVLAAAVLDRILAPLNLRRIELLEAALATTGDECDLQSLVDALIRPDVESATILHGRGAGRARLIGAIYLNPNAFVRSQVEGHFAPVAERFMPHLIRAVPGIPPVDLSWRVRWFVFGPVGALMFDDSELFRRPLDETVGDIVSSASAAISNQRNIYPSKGR